MVDRWDEFGLEFRSGIDPLDPLEASIGQVRVEGTRGYGGQRSRVGMVVRRVVYALRAPR